MVGAGGVIAVMFSAYFGRLPVLFWFMVIATATALGQAGSHGFNGFFVPRVLNGFFSGAAQGVSVSSHRHSLVGTNQNPRVV